jgi:EmrB/QacA subfamily drug resistance transporter
MLGMFLAALEATAVAAAVPTAVGELGGVERFSWVFSAYLLTSTTTVPLYGKLADLYGRKRIYQISVGIFLLGSILSGLAGSIEQLILFRAIQGIGAGGVMPVAITLTGDIFTLEERGRYQWLFSGVWAVASLVGPLLGGWITDVLSWRWIFFLCIPFGIASALVLQLYFNEETERHDHRLDILGTISLTVAVTFLLLGTIEGPGAWGWSDPRTLGLFAGAVAAFVLFLWQETRAPEPMLPLEIFRNRVIAVSSVGNTLLGILLFSLTAYVPMFAQGVQGGTATDAGTILTPILIGWPISSTVGGWIFMRVGYRRMAIGGGMLLVAGALLLAQMDTATPRLLIMLSMLLIGLGLGFTSMPYLLGPQNAVPWRLRGVATSSVQFFRTIGGAVCVTALGALLNSRLEARAGAGISPNTALDPALRAKASPEALATLTTGLLEGLHAIYVVLLGITVVSLAVAFLVPPGSAESFAHREEPAAKEA